MSHSQIRMNELDLSFDRDLFLRTLLNHLSGSLEDIIGLEEASGFISIVGQQIGEQFNDEYRQALQLSQLDREQVARVLVDLKQRIQGDFSIVSEDNEKIVLKTTSCPFGDKVIGRRSLCMMTSNVFGTIAAENLGYARVELNQTIAQGAAGCLITVHLKASENGTAQGEEYFHSADG